MQGSLDLPHVALSAAGSRRRWIGQVAGLAAGAALTRGAWAAERIAPPARHQHLPFGPVVPPRAIPSFRIATHTGANADLGSLLRGRTSAVQLMFTGCSATCPIQGALFAQAQGLMASRARSADMAGIQFVSLSIDPLGDPPARLDRWLRGFGATANWWAGAPRVNDVERLSDTLGRDGEPRPGGSDPHTGQVFIVDRRGELAFRTAGMPSAETILDALRAVAVAR